MVSSPRQHQKIPAVRFLAEPAKSFVEVLAAAHHGGPSNRSGCAVSLVAQTKVLIGRGRSGGGKKEYGQEKKQNRRPGNFQRHDLVRDDLVINGASTI